METSRASGENTRVAEDVLRIAALAAMLRVVCMDHEGRLHQQCLPVTCPPQPRAEIELTGRVPFSFAFVEGHRTPFYVPSGHHFVIEHLAVSCWSGQEIHEVRLVTRSRRIFLHMTLWSVSEQSSHQNSKTDESHSILVRGSTANALLFSDGAGHSSFTVPPDTCVQLWGYLEPTADELSF
jgi:hypothetical protein